MTWTEPEVQLKLKWLGRCACPESGIVIEQSSKIVQHIRTGEINLKAV